MRRIRSDDYRKYDAERKRKHQAKGQAIIRRLKTMKGCAVCGYKKHHAALEFNHIDPSTKLCNISHVTHYAVFGRNTKSKKKLKDELSKCEVLCAICHRIKTFEGQHWKVNK